mgnify:CR=1 FL=1
MTTPDAAPPDLPDDPRLADALGLIGGATHQYLPAKGTLYTWIALLSAGVLLGVGLLAFLAANEVSMRTAGVPLIPGDRSKPGVVKRIVGCVLAVKVAVLCGLFMRSKLHELSGRVLAGPRGFVVYRGPRKEPEAYTWDDIASLHQDPVDPAKYATEGGPPMKRDTSFCVLRRDGRIFGFWVDSLRDHKAFARWLYAEGQARGIPWVFGPPNG